MFLRANLGLKLRSRAINYQTVLISFYVKLGLKMASVTWIKLKLFKLERRLFTLDPINMKST
jgi:hypothetical protein